MAQTANPPSHILFYCDVPAKEGAFLERQAAAELRVCGCRVTVSSGGSTPIVRSDVVMRQLQASASAPAFPRHFMIHIALLAAHSTRIARFRSFGRENPFHPPSLALAGCSPQVC
jgi:hypothetical protein